MNMSQSKVRPLAFLAAVGLAAILISAVIAVDADAARGARGGGGKPSGSTATLTLSPSSVTAWTEYTISGSGFDPNATVLIGERYPNATYWGQLETNGDGTFTATSLAHDPQQVVIEAFQQANHRSWELKASATLTIVAP